MESGRALLPLVVIMFALLCVVQSADVEKDIHVKCDMYWSRFGDFCYHFTSVRNYNDRKSWEGAQNNCKGMGGNLVSINSKEEAEFIFNKVGLCSGQTYWIGYKQDKDGGDYKWCDGSTSAYGTWLCGKANDKKGDNCAYIKPTSYGNRFVNGPCASITGYICEKSGKVAQ